jgi:hypothetical protein
MASMQVEHFARQTPSQKIPKSQKVPDLYKRPDMILSSLTVPGCDKEFYP